MSNETNPFVGNSVISEKQPTTPHPVRSVKKRRWETPVLTLESIREKTDKNAYYTYEQDYQGYSYGPNS
jgi:hypothetical protein